jgi:hypothetical protein
MLRLARRERACSDPPRPVPRAASPKPWRAFIGTALFPAAAARAGNHIPLALVGGPFLAPHWKWLDELEAAGGRASLNATETGERSLGPAFEFDDRRDPPFDALVRGCCDHIWLTCSSGPTRGSIPGSSRGWPPAACAASCSGISPAAIFGAPRRRPCAKLSACPVLLLEAGGENRAPPRANATASRLCGNPSNERRAPRKLNLDEWDARYEQLRRDGLREPGYGGPLRRHVVREKDFRLQNCSSTTRPPRSALEFSA